MPEPRPDFPAVELGDASLEQGHHAHSGRLGPRPRRTPGTIVAGIDGRDKIQMRTDLGLIQMELDGPPRRPPRGRRRVAPGRARGPGPRRRGRRRVLRARHRHAVRALMREGLQYYHRYLAAFHLQRYDLVVRDTERNLRLFAFVVRHATRQRDKLEFDRFRPYVTMMHTRARAARPWPATTTRRPWPRSTRGSSGIRAFLREYGQSEQEAECFELGFLLRLRREVDGGTAGRPGRAARAAARAGRRPRRIRGGRPDPRPAPAAPRRRCPTRELAAPDFLRISLIDGRTRLG